MSEQHKGSKSIGVYVETKEGERGPLCCNKANVRSPSLGFNPNGGFATNDSALRYLASILVQAYLDQKNDGEC